MQSQRILFFILCCLSSSVYSQDFNPIKIPLSLDGTTLDDAWIGGLNCPQLSQIDLNQDGFLDLHLFDRVGNVQLTYLHEGKVGSTQYQYAPEYLEAFPEVQNWMLLKDYNGDGVQDIFCYSTVPGIDGLSVYTGSYENGTLQFEAFKFNTPFGVASFPSSNGNQLQVFISKIDYPGIEDIDCDGDLDVLTFNISGGYVEYYRNLSQEQGFGLDSLVFILEENCWGGFFESGIGKEVDFAANPGDCFSPNSGDLAVNFRHTGSTLMVFDPDKDGDKDLVLGDLSFDNLNMLTNAGDCDQAWMNQQDINFPNTENPVDLPSFPISFYLDLNQDGQEDLLAAPNFTQGSEDQDVLWFYEGKPGDPMPSFELKRKDFLVGEMLDLGTNAFPTFVDYNADGLLDLVIGNYSEYGENGQIDSRLFLFENVGSQNSPAFQLIDEDFLEMSQFNPSSYRFVPVFADLDSDGDQDILVGEAFGQLYYGENSAGPGKPIRITQLRFAYMGIDVGLASSPTVADVNDDGLLDLIVGERTGNVNYFQNIGSANNPQFEADLSAGNNTDRFGDINTRFPGFIIGNSAPHVFYENGIAKILTGTEQGNIALYTSPDQRLDGMLTLENEQLAGFRAGTATAVAVADIDNDGYLEMLIGNERGGLQFLNTPFQSDLTTSTKAIEQLTGVSVFPNPARDFIRIKHQQIPSRWQIKISTINGQQIHWQELNQTNAQVNTSSYSPGIYLLEVRSAGGRWVEKLVIH